MVENKQIPKIAAYGTAQINLQSKMYYSDVFFWQQSLLPAKNVLIYSSRQTTVRHWQEIQEAGMHIVALHPRLVDVDEIPIFSPSFHIKTKQLNQRQGSFHFLERWFLDTEVWRYNYKKHYWLNFFEQYGIKVHYSEFKYDNEHIAIADVLNELGGVSAMWQRSYEEFATPEATIVADLLFSFTPQRFEIEKQNNSRISYHIATGYHGDFRFPILRNQAQQVRASLQKNGARHIIAFYDEATGDDGRWCFSHSVAQTSYSFLLEKVLAEPWLGLVIKPKKPNTLRYVLGEFDELLDRAEATGRCYVYYEKEDLLRFPPAGAALAADIAINDNVYAVTAALESVLAGIPTLLLDRENWNVSQLYQFEAGKVIFPDWQSLWNTLIDHWNTPQGISGLGDWSLLFDELDPFRDGKAAERIGTYLHWLIQGFEQGLKRDTILADAAERYGQQWGYDKIVAGL